MARYQYRFLTDNITTDRDSLPPNVRLSYQIESTPKARDMPDTSVRQSYHTDNVGPLLSYDPVSIVSSEKQKRRRNHTVTQSQQISPSLFATLPVT